MQTFRPFSGAFRKMYTLKMDGEVLHKEKLCSLSLAFNLPFSQMNKYKCSYYCSQYFHRDVQITHLSKKISARMT